MTSEIEALANEAVSFFGPSKSSEKYSAAYDHFVNRCNSKSVTVLQENVFLAYFNTMARDKKWKSSTLWSRYSMIKSQLAINHERDSGKYLKLRALLKKSNEGYHAKKSRVFSKEQFERFLFEAPDDLYLVLKIVLLFGVAGACRCDEMMKMKTTDIDDMGTIIMVNIPDSKTRKVRTFIEIGDNQLKIYRRYAAL